VTTEIFIEYLNQELLNRNEDWKENIDIERWVYQPGLPDNCPQIKSDRFEKVEEQLKEWKEGKPAKKLVTNNWSTYEWVHFLRNLPEIMNPDQLKDLDDAFGFTKSGNAEIQTAWFVKAIPNNYLKAKPAVEECLIEVDRRKFLTPIYKDHLDADHTNSAAREIYKE